LAAVGRLPTVLTLLLTLIQRKTLKQPAPLTTSESKAD